MSDREWNENWENVYQFKPRKHVIFDIDDVLMPWAERVHLACVEAGIAKADHKWTQWSMHLDYGCAFEDWLAVVNSLVVPNGIYHAPPYPGVLDAMQILVEHDIPISLVTARGFFDHATQIRQWTHDWVEKFNVPGNLYFYQDKGVIAKEIGATHAIDDRTKNLVEMAEVGVKTYLMTQPHNASEDWPEDYRVGSVSEFVERVLADG